MQITGENLIGSQSIRGTDSELRALNPATGELLDPIFHGASPDDIDRACNLAEAAFDPFRAAPLTLRAQFLETIAQGLLDLGDTLITRVMAESALPRPRVEGELARTAGQLRLFASIVREGRWLSATLDPALPHRKPQPRPDLRAQKIPLGPVAVFGASNFPLAFSVAGGDTASALAAGCPVVAKSHPSHLGTSELAGRVIQQSVAACNLPEGVFSLLLGEGNAVGEALVLHPAIQAVGFTGSRRGGRALVSLAASRDTPIPVFAEMSSLNPVFLLPSALAHRADSIAQAFIDSVTLGVGQFCTKPGLLISINGPDAAGKENYARFRSAAQSAIAPKSAATMLNPAIHRAFCQGATHWASDPNLLALTPPKESPAHPAGHTGQPMLFSTSAKHFLQTPHLLDEVFGPAALLIECTTEDDLLAVAHHLDGQLTATLHLDPPADTPLARTLLPILERKAGRILANGFPTGVEVSYAMVHGGPPPATSDSRSTSVGAMAIDRFLRPVCYQNLPATLLPDALQDANPLHLTRLLDGKLHLPQRPE